LLFGHKNRSQGQLQVDLGDLQNEKEHLSNFLRSNQVSIASVENNLTVNSEKLSAQELQRLVTRFIYHRDFNTTHWVSIEGATVKINRFETTVKKTEKHKKGRPHQNVVQSWGL
jgi:hypothetical protein